MARLILSTPRLVLREFELADAQQLFELNGDSEVVRHTGDGPFASLEAARQFLAAYPDYRRNGFGRWAVLRATDGAFMGWCGLKRVGEQVDLGYRLHRRHWGSGIATEAARACVAHGFEVLGLAELIGRVSADNPASIRVLEKCGMRLWTRAPCEGIENALVYRVRRDEAYGSADRGACQRAPDSV